MVRIASVCARACVSVCAAVLAAIGAAAAQPAKPPTQPEAIAQFVSAFITPTRTTGRMARWENGICPLTAGQQPAVTAFVTQRVKEVAALVGAPVNSDPSCRPNIEIVFSRIPQDLLDNIRDNQSDYLGYADSSAERQKLATVTRPIQAWYTTQTVDQRGKGRIDGARSVGRGATEAMGDATFVRATGSLIKDGVRSAFYHIIIVADDTKLTGYEAGPMADYIAMLALTQLNSLDICQPLFSIENMMAKGCEAKTGKLTDNDIAYLRGVYRMSPDRKQLSSQKNDIVDVMNQALNGP